MQISTQKIFQILQTLTGSEFVGELQSFFKSIEGWQNHLFERTQKMNSLLLNSNTIFNLVIAFDSAKINEATMIARELKKGKYNLSLITINKFFPNWLPKPFNTGSEIDLYCKELNSFYESRLKSMIQLEILNSKNVSDDNLTKDSKEFALDFLLLPEYDHDISDLAGIQKLVKDYKWVESLNNL